MYICICVYTEADRQTDRQTDRHVCLHIYMSRDIYIYIYIYMCLSTYRYIHIYICIYIYYTHMYHMYILRTHIYMDVMCRLANRDTQSSPHLRRGPAEHRRATRPPVEKTCPERSRRPPVHPNPEGSGIQYLAVSINWGSFLWMS